MKKLLTLIALISLLAAGNGQVINTGNHRGIFTSSNPTPALVGTPAIGDVGSLTLTSLTTNAVSHTAGNTIVVFVRTGTANNTITAPTNTAGDTFVHAASSYYGTSTTSDVWYTCRTLGNASDIVTAHFSSSQFNVVFAVELSNTLPSCLDVAQTGNTGAGTSTITSSSFAPLLHSYILAMGNQDCANSNWNPGTGYTILGHGGGSGISIEGMADATASSQTTSITIQSATCTTGISVAAFK